MKKHPYNNLFCQRYVGMVSFDLTVAYPWCQKHTTQELSSDSDYYFVRLCLESGSLPMSYQCEEHKISQTNSEILDVK